MMGWENKLKSQKYGIAPMRYLHFYEDISFQKSQKVHDLISKIPRLEISGEQQSSDTDSEERGRAGQARAAGAGAGLRTGEIAAAAAVLGPAGRGLAAG